MMLNAQYDVCIAPRSPRTILALIGVLSAIFILPEVYGFEQDSEPARRGTPLEPA
jgi:hypothetical protein